MLRAAALRTAPSGGARAPARTPHRSVRTFWRPATPNIVQRKDIVLPVQLPRSAPMRACYGTAAASPREQPTTPPQPSTLKSSTSLRKHINSFLKHVHPDLFHEEGDCERVNLDSLQKLHCFVDEVKQFENGASHGAIPRYLELKFYVKANPQLAYHDELAPSITAKFTMPNELFEIRDRTAQKTAIVSTAVRQVVDLLKQAGVDVPTDEQLTSMPEPFKAPSSGALQPPRKVTAWVSDVATDMNDAFYDALRQYRNNIITEERWAGTKAYERLIQRAELTSLFNPANVYFHPKLTVEQQKQGLRRLKSNLTRLGFEQWCDLPIFMTENEWSAAAHRALVIPYNFSLREMKLYLMNELPRVKEERERFRIALSNAIDLCDNLTDNFPVSKISASSDMHPSDVCEIVRGLTEIIRGRCESDDQDGEFAAICENAHWIMTRHVAQFEIRTTPDEFMVLVPRNFDGYELVDRLKTEYAEWLERARPKSQATEKMHSAAGLAMYTTMAGLPLNALTHKPPPRIEEDEDEAAAAKGEERLTEEEKEARQHKRALTSLFTSYLTARTKESPLLSGWQSAMGESTATETHTLAQMRAVSVTLLPLQSFVEMTNPPSPVSSLAKAPLVPLASVPELAADENLLAKFDALIGQLQNFAVALRDEVPSVIEQLPRSKASSTVTLAGDVNERVNEELDKAIRRDVTVSMVREENAALQLEARTAEIDQADMKEEGKGDRDREKNLDKDENADVDAAGAASQPEGMDMLNALNPGQQQDEMPGQGQGRNQDLSADELEDLQDPDVPDPDSIEHELQYIPKAIEDLAESLPAESAIGSWMRQMQRSLQYFVEQQTLSELVEKDLLKETLQGAKEKDEAEDGVAEADLVEAAAPVAAAEAGKDKDGAKEKDENAGEELDEKKLEEELTKDREDELDEDQDEGDGKPGRRRRSRKDDEEEEEEEDDDDDVLKSGTHMKKLIDIRDLLADSKVKAALTPTLHLAYTDLNAQLLRSSLEAVGLAHADLQAAIAAKLRSNAGFAASKPSAKPSASKARK